MELFIGFLVLALLLIPYKIETQTMLNAPQKEVIDVLKNFENYGKWNPFIVSVKGEFTLNALLEVKLNMDNKMMYISPKIVKIEENMFCWRGILGVRYIFDGIHCFKTESMPKDRTLFTHTEYFQGLLVWIMFPLLIKTKKRFELMNEALSDEVTLNKKNLK